ncbi:hypothetical protein BRARA_J01723 [Brassica rapa]|uniref:Neprosin PEP catalytic domain-containing protein n=1 Tax=Brassica campestris TaxID=3711 RepID=A0A397XL91_BRACM|nr:hypothetical protein BRARA_J01723 [Brassica rapa]
MEVFVLVFNKRSIFLIFLVFVSFFLTQKVTHVSAVNNTKPHRQVSSLRAERIQKHLNKINKPSVFTIQSPDGDIIDCVPKRKQPALDHPLLKHHKIQKAPTRMPQIMEKERSVDVEEAANVLESAWQMWHVNGTRCPKGTVPIRRNTMNDVLRAKSLFDFGKKRRSIDLDRRTEKPDALGTSGHEHAIAYTETSSEIYGAKATINVWDPKIEEVNEFSLSQIWILSGSFVGPDLNSIEAGWQLFTHLADHATTVEWGGEVVNTRSSGRHTTTQMGSGHFPDEGFGKASYFRNLEIVDSDNSLVPVHDVKILAENTECYDIKSSYSNEWGTYFYYGGPGFNPRCA